ncbi:hypothetical protein HMPREF3130_06765 [Corynebacterium sp. HMSC14B06]|uniref:hypothetical protein n=1 Tax=unclassified Corynebacterium TaxID=2624378 RepID=UPI0008A22BFB|nr:MULTISPECIES: hypothetical protein [unclassified Corynebacterium]OFL73767.1 hypothetical protein HMPREF2752_00555 [Corynebacterium sp. HMSC077C02]OFT70627.1 hypothetical protein HMPREF3130_06765 [Corynebacterium sp. HMSC14B06]
MSLSQEEFAEAVGSTDSENMATLTVGPVTFTAPTALVEFYVALINAALIDDPGFRFLDLGTEGDGYATVLVTSATPVSVSWPDGYRPFEKPNKLLDSVAHTDLL